MTQFWLLATKTKPFFKSKGLIYSFLLTSSLFMASCRNTESDLGLNLRADKGEIYAAETDTFTVNAFTVREDSLETSSLSTSLLGAMNDPDFGISTAILATQISITQKDISFGPTPKLDSAILYIAFDKKYSYGNLNSTQYMNVYYLNEVLDINKKYFSNYQATLGTEIGVWNGKFSLTDSVSFREGNKIVKKAPGIKIKLNKKVATDLANADPSVYSSIESFKAFLKGIVLIPQKGGIASGQGGIASVDIRSGNSKLIIHYNDTSQQSFVLNDNCVHFNNYSKKDLNSDLISQLAKPGTHQNTSYVQSMAGCKTRIEIPHLLNLAKNLNNERIIINEAALVFTPKNGSISSEYPLPLRLNLLQPKNAANDQYSDLIQDFLDYINPQIGVRSGYGGTYNSLTGEYTIRFTRHLQSVVNKYFETGENLNRGFYVTIPSDSPMTPSRLILNNTRLPNYKALKLRLTYTKVKN
jgi:hypothetical protein